MFHSRLVTNSTCRAKVSASIFTTMEINKQRKLNHENLFEQISEKLDELSRLENKTEKKNSLSLVEAHIRQSQKEIENTKNVLTEKIASLEKLHETLAVKSLDAIDYQKQLEFERQAQLKLSQELGQALDFNLRLQWEIEQRKKENDLLKEEMKAQEQLEISWAAELRNVQTTSLEQSQMVQKFSDLAEDQISHLKNTLIERENQISEYHARLEQAIQQIDIIKTENKTLRDYVVRLQSQLSL